MNCATALHDTRVCVYILMHTHANLWYFETIRTRLHARMYVCVYVCVCIRWVTGNLRGRIVFPSSSHAKDGTAKHGEEQRIFNDRCRAYTPLCTPASNYREHGDCATYRRDTADSARVKCGARVFPYDKLCVYFARRGARSRVGGLLATFLFESSG